LFRCSCSRGAKLRFLEQYVIDTPRSWSREQEEQSEQGKHEGMLIFVPKPSVAHHERDIAKGSNGQECTNACEQSQREKDTGDQLGSLSGVDKKLTRRSFECIPFHIGTHELRPENFVSMVSNQQADYDSKQADGLIGRMGWGSEDLHFDIGNRIDLQLVISD